MMPWGQLIILLFCLLIQCVPINAQSPDCDWTGDGRCDMYDFAKLASNWLETVEIPPATGVAQPLPNPVYFIYNGIANGDIVTSTAPSGNLSYQAAVLLQTKLKAMSGANPAVKDYQASGLASRRLIVGPIAAAAVGVNVPQTYPSNEGFIIKRVPNTNYLVLAGNDAGNYRGTMNAVLAWLEMLGWKMYRYDDPDYEIIPQLSSVTFRTMDISRQPVFEYRAPSLYNTHASIQIWRDWLGVGGLQIGQGPFTGIPTSECSSHPDYFSWNGSAWVPCQASGAWQYNTSNPGVINAAAEYAANLFGTTNYISAGLSQRDEGGYSMDPDSLALVAPYTNKDSARFALFANAVQELVEQRYPQYADRYYVFYSYWHTKYAPTPNLYLNSNVVPMIVGDYDHVHLWTDPSNATIRSVLEGWIDISISPVAIYEWYIPGLLADSKWRAFPWIAVRKPILDLRYFQEKGIRWIYYELDALHNVNRLPYQWIPIYMACRGMWDPGQNPITLLKQLCQDLYGNGWESMFKYYDLLDLTMLNSPLTSGNWYLPNPSDLFGHVKDQADALLLQAAQDAGSDSPEVQQRIQDAIDLWNTGWANL